jgi:hypothetical protein
VFLGHFAASIAASRTEPRLPLGTSFILGQLPDVLWPAFLLAGIERVTIAPGDTAFTPLRFDRYPWSHSLAFVVFWACVAGAIVWWRGRAVRPALLGGLLVVSHWVLDAASHRPDVPVFPSGPFVGLGLWNSVAATLIVEGLMFAAAVFFYARDRRVTKGFWWLMGVLVALYLVNLVGPPPPSVPAIAISCLVLMPILWWWGNRVGNDRAPVA